MIPSGNLFNNSFGAATTEAVLYIISPRRYSNQAKRPLLYNFDGEFINKADEAVSRMAQQSQPNGIKHITSQATELYRVISPSMNPSHVIDLRVMANTWTFMLVVTNERNPGGMGNRAGLDNQHFYYGYFDEEPVNPFAHNGNVTLNPNSRMMVTHKTIINKHSTVAAHQIDNRLSVMADVDVVYPHFVGSTTQQPTTLMLHDQLLNSITDGSIGDAVVMHSESNLLERQEAPVPIRSLLSVPRYNINKVLHAIADARGSVSADHTAGSFGHNSGNSVLSMGRDTYRGMVEQNLHDNVNLHRTGLDTNQVILLSAVMDRYHPRAQVIKQDAYAQYTPIDQMTIGARNIFCSMISVIVPSVMADFMLADVAFSYDSYREEFVVSQEVLPATITLMSPDEIRARVNALFTRLRLDVFPIIKQSQGDFVLNVHSSCSSVTSLNLNFFDSTLRTNEVFEVPTIYGGINSLMIGTATEFDHNARQLNHLVSSMVENEQDPIPLSVHDNHQYSQSLLSYDAGISGATTPPVNNNPWNL